MGGRYSQVDLSVHSQACSEHLEEFTQLNAWRRGPVFQFLNTGELQNQQDNSDTSDGQPEGQEYRARDPWNRRPKRQIQGNRVDHSSRQPA